MFKESGHKKLWHSHKKELQQSISLCVTHIPWCDSCCTYRNQLFNGEVVTELSISSIAPWALVNCHAVLPFVLQQVSWVVAVSTCVISAVCTNTTLSPSIISHNSVPHRAVNAALVIYGYALTFKMSCPQNMQYLEILFGVQGCMNHNQGVRIVPL